jgi:NADPH-dependent ferric siderophore reductase
MAAACLLLGSRGAPRRAPRGHRPRGRISLRPTATSRLFVADDCAMPAAFVLREALPADSPATDLLVTGHGSNSRPAPTGAPATSLVWMSRAVTLEMLSDLHLAEGTAAYLLGERQPADATARQKGMRFWMSVVSGAR